MTRRARLFLIVPLVLLLALLVLATAPVPATGFPTRTVYDRKIPAPGSGPIVAGDVNGDGRTDLVAIDERDGAILVFLQGDAGLPGAADLSIPGLVPRTTLLADMDGDGQTDLVAMTSNSTFLYFQDNGTFGKRIAEVSTANPIDIAVADLNGDGAQDLAVLGTNGVGIWFQNRTRGGWASAAVLNLTASGFHDLEIADLQRDGWPDLILGKPFEMRVYYGGPQGLDLQGDPSYLDSMSGTVSLSLAVGDIDGDGWQDVIMSEADPQSPGSYGRIAVYRQENGGFTRSDILEGTLAGPFALGDANDDGATDLIAAETEPLIDAYLQRFAGGFDATPTFQLALDGAGGASGIAVGRFTGRPFSDIVARTTGFLLLYEQEDVPPVLLRTIPSDHVFNAGASGAGLVDLRNYFADDHKTLFFQIVYEENPDVLDASVAADGHHLDFVAAPSWYGRAQFQVSATDGVPGHSPVMSNVFSVIVNALPSIASTPPAEARVGEAFEYQVIVQDPYPADDTHTFSLATAPYGMRIDPQTGLVEWTPTEAGAGSQTVRIEVTDAYGGSAEQVFELEVVIPPAPTPTTVYIVAGVGTALAALGLGTLAIENLKYGLLMIFIPLYSKIKREQVLDHFVRGQIYGYVLANPGEHYNAIKVALNLTNGSLAHHLKTLEREEFLKSKRFGLYRRFYPMHMRIPEDGFFAANEIQKTIVDLIRARPGITQKEISDRLGLTPPTVNYHVGILSEHNQIRVERAGRKTHCFVVGNPGPANPGP